MKQVGGILGRIVMGNVKVKIFVNVGFNVAMPLVDDGSQRGQRNEQFRDDNLLDEFKIDRELQSMYSSGGKVEKSSQSRSGLKTCGFQAK